MGKRKGKSLKKNHAVDVEEIPEVVNAPHSFVIHRGLAFPNLVDLTLDFRRMMEPFTASQLKERKNNKIKDFVSLSSMFHVSHMSIFNKSANQLSFKVARLPKGPTLSFKVHQFTLARDVLSSMKKQYFNNTAFKHAPLVILNNFTGEGNHLKLMANTFQNMFPSINLATVNLSTIKRCVLFSFNPATQLVDMRHYAVVVAPIGLNRSVKKVIMGKVPNLSKCEDISDFVEQSGMLSESEYEDDDGNEVVLPQTLKSRGNLENNKSAIRLYEIGPRITIELIKVQDDLFKGETLYHNAIVKTEEELAEIKKERAEKKRLKELRRKIQNQNVAKKQKSKEEHKNKSMAGNGVKREKDENGEDEEEIDNDAEYYKEEVGVEPDEELFQTSGMDSRKRAFVPKQMKYKGSDAKRQKLDKNVNDQKDGKKFKKTFNKSTTSNDFNNDKKFGGKKRFDSSNGSEATSSKKVNKKVKPKKKGKKKAHRNKNK